jgi:hypothetical protein
MKRILLPAILASLAFHPTIVRADDEEAELKEQPAAVQKTAHAEIGSAEITEVEPAFENGQHATEVEYTENGNKMAIDIAKDGTLIQKEHRMSPAQAPDVIKKAVAALYPTGKITFIKQVERKDATFFEVSVRGAGKAHLLNLDPNGKPLK